MEGQLSVRQYSKVLVLFGRKTEILKERSSSKENMINRKNKIVEISSNVSVNVVTV